MKQVLRHVFLTGLILSLLLSALGIPLIVHGLDENPALEDPAPENPVPENPVPENPTPENPAPENPAAENPVINAPALYPYPFEDETKSVEINLIIHPNNGYNDENITIPTTLVIIEKRYTIEYSFKVDESIHSILNRHGIKYPTNFSKIDILQLFNLDSKELLEDCWMYPRYDKLELNTFIFRNSPSSKTTYEEFKKALKTKELHLIILWELGTGQNEVNNHIHCLFQPPFGPLLQKSTRTKPDSGYTIYELRECPEVNFYALEGGSLSYLYHGNATTRTADGKHFRIISNPTSDLKARWVDIIYCMKESWENYPAQQAYIMPEPIPDEGYAFDYWEESRVPTLLENLYKKIENEEQNDNSLSYLIEHPWDNWPGGIPGDGILEWDWSTDFDNWYYGIFNTGITYIAHFKKIDDGSRKKIDEGSRLIPCPYGVCNNQPTVPYVVEPIVNPIVKPIEKPAPLNLPRTASAQK